MIKLALFDIDGTLYDHDAKTIPASAVLAFQKLKEKGIITAIASGRSKVMADFVEEYGVIPDYYLSSNGHCVEDHDQHVIAERTFTKEDVEALYQVCKDKEVSLTFKFDDASYVYHHYDFVVQDSAGLQLIANMMRDCPTHDRHLINLPYGGVIYDRAHIIDQVAKALPQFDFVAFNTDKYDVYLKGISKAWGVHALCEHLKISKDECIAFGDHMNDLEMIQSVGIGVAMGNAFPTLKEHANMVCDRIDADGIYKALKELGLID